MSHTIAASFASRRAAELAVERLVQEHGIDRAAITIRPEGTDNSAGTRPAGADAQSGHPGTPADGTPALAGEIEVRVACTAADQEAVRAALREAGSHPPGT